jgi:hypothetical protein
MPSDSAGAWWLQGRGTDECKILDALGVKMDFALAIARETLEEFGEGALRSVAPVHER